MAKSDKSVGVNSKSAGGIGGAVQWAEDTYESAKKYFTTIDAGSIAGKLRDRDDQVKKAIEDATK